MSVAPDSAPHDGEHDPVSSQLSSVAALRRKALSVATVNGEAVGAGDGPGGTGPGGPGDGGGGSPDTGLPFNPRDNQGNAAQLLDSKYTTPDGYRTLILQNGGIMEWAHDYGWRPIKELALPTAIRMHFECKPVFVRGKRDELFHVNKRFVSEVSEAVTALLFRADDLRPPCYLAPAYITVSSPPSRVPADRFVPVANGRVDLGTLRLEKPSPAFFTLASSPIPFDGRAKCKRWLAFIEDIFEDADMVEALQDFAGYALGDSTRMQKVLWIVGPPRSGKGTVLRMIEKVIGETNVGGGDLNALAGNFSLAPFISKKLAVFGDVEVSSRADKKVILGNIKGISGEDTQTVDRKHKEPWTGRLPTRLIFASNELPQFGDNSNAFPARVILLMTKKSFLGKEDVDLEAGLAAELPGILNWMLAGLVRSTSGGGLCSRRRQLTRSDPCAIRVPPCPISSPSAALLGQVMRFLTRRSTMPGKPGTSSKAPIAGLLSRNAASSCAQLFRGLTASSRARAAAASGATRA